MVDEARDPLGLPDHHHLLDDLLYCARGRADCSGARIAPESPAPAEDLLRLLARKETGALVDRNQPALAHDNLALGGKVHRHDGNLLAVDIEPDIEFGPVREGEGADALAAGDPAVVEVP